MLVILPFGEAMKTLKMTIELKFDENKIHRDDPEAIEWFYNDILKRQNPNNTQLLLLHCNEIGDTIGEVKVLEIHEAK